MTYKLPWSFDADRPHTFVCYSHRDRAAVLEQIRDLHDAGFNIWFDEGMHAGSEWPEELAKAISGCECLLYFVTPSSVATFTPSGITTLATSIRPIRDSSRLSSTRTASLASNL